MKRITAAISIVSFGLLWNVWINQAQSSPHATPRPLTLAETELANAARVRISKVIERNLIRLFAAMIVEENRQARQQQQQEEEEEDDGAETATINPHTLPQVAALLGAIFSGNLNLTNVVDRAFFLVPDTVRSQVTGIFKLLGGPSDANANNIKNKGESTAATVLPAYFPHPLDTTITPNKFSDEISSSIQPEEVEFTTRATVQPENPVFGSVFETKNKTPPPLTTNKPLLELDLVVPIAENFVNDDAFNDDDIGEDELKKAEQEVIDEAKLVEPFVKDKEPRFFLGSLQQLFQSPSLNFTTIFRSMPDLFRGAQTAFALLRQLGQIFSGEND